MVATRRTAPAGGTTAGQGQLLGVNGVDLCVETFGNPADPAILLLTGQTDSMDWWEDELCRRLAAGPRFVIRYDQRDTGASPVSPAGDPGYGFDDLVADALGVLDRLEVDRAHVFGVSLGGAVAQRLAVGHGARLASMTLASTSPGMRPNAAPYPDLPMMAPELLVAYTDPDFVPDPDPDWSDPGQVIDWMVAGRLRMAGPRGFDPEHLRRLAVKAIGRTVDIEASLTNHGKLTPGEEFRSELAGTRVPTLVVHGTDDPLFPFGHAEALARETSADALLPLVGVGHQMPPPWTWDEIVPAVLRHTDRP